MQFVGIDEARSASGVRLVVVGAMPSPWSEAAKGLFTVKRIDAKLVRFLAGDEAVKQWTGSQSAPVLFVDAEPPRTHWSEILEASERLGGAESLVPSDPEERARMFGLAHELLGEGGLAWSQRIVVIHRGLTSGGREGFPLRVARYLVPKYGYAPERVEPSRRRAVATLRRFGAMVEEARASGRESILPSGFSALDIYLATALTVFAPPSEEQCPGMNPALRRAFETAAAEIRAEVSDTLLEHRDRVYRQHLGLPVEV